MRAITLWQPWASLIAEGEKTVETRPLQHPWRSGIGQTIAIHAAKRKPFVIEATQYADWCERAGWPGLPLGAIVATCTLTDVIPIGDKWHPTIGESEAVAMLDGRVVLTGDPGSYRAGEAAFGDYTPGRWALVLDNVQKVEPVFCRGYQGLWTVPARVADNLVSRCA